MARERLARIGAPDDEAQHLLRYARAVKQLDELRADRRGLFRRLEDDRIARDQGRDDMPVRQMRREIIRAKHGDRTMRHVAHRVAQPHRALDAAVGGAFGIGLEQNIDLRSEEPTSGPQALMRIWYDSYR